MSWLAICILVLAVAALYALVLLARWAVICACEEVRRHVAAACSGYDGTPFYSLEAVMVEAQSRLERLDTDNITEKEHVHRNQ